MSVFEVRYPSKHCNIKYNLYAMFKLNIVSKIARVNGKAGPKENSCSGSRAIDGLIVSI